MAVPGQRPAGSATDAADQDQDRVRAIFKQMDADGSGSIDVDELTDAMLLLGVKCTKNSAKKVLAVIDKDKNGTVEWDEFYSFFVKVRDPEEIKHLLAAQNAKFLDYKMMVEKDSNFGKTFYVPPALKPELHCLGHEEEITGVSWISPTEFISCSLDKSMMVWDVKDFESRCKKGMRSGVYEMRGGDAKQTIEDLGGGIYCMSTSDWKLIPEKRSKLVVAGLSERQNNVVLYDIEKGEKKSTYSGHAVPIYSVALAPDCYYFCSGDQVGKLFLFDVNKSSEPLSEIKAHEKVIYSIDYNPDPSGSVILSTGSDGQIKITDLRAPTAPKALVTIDDAAATGVCFDAKWRNEFEIVSVGDDYSAKRWDIRNLSDGPKTNYFGHTTILKKICVSTDQNNSFIMTAGDEGSCRLWQVDERDQISVALESASGNLENIQADFIKMEKARDEGEDYDVDAYKSTSTKVEELTAERDRLLEISRERDGLNCVQGMMSFEGPKGTGNTGMAWLTKDKGDYSLVTSNSDLAIRLYNFKLGDESDSSNLKSWRTMFELSRSS